MASLETSLKSTSPHNKNKNETALTFCHGVSNGTSFSIPPKINIVTIMNLGDNCPLIQGLDLEFQAFLQRGSKFFEYNSVRRTPECEALQSFLNGKVEESNAFLTTIAKEEGRMSSNSPSFNIRNHVEESEMNNAELTFSDGTNALMSTMIYDDRGTYIKTVPIKYLDPDTGAEVKRIDMTRLITYLCGLNDFDSVTKMNGRLTIVLVICREVKHSLDKPTLTLMRQRSDDNDFLPMYSLSYIHGLPPSLPDMPSMPPSLPNMASMPPSPPINAKNGLIGQIVDINKKDGTYTIQSSDGKTTTAPVRNVELVSRVQLTGLTTVAKNGLKGTFIKYSPDTGRFEIKMDIDGKTILVKLNNLIGLYEPTGGRKTRRHNRKKVRQTRNVRHPRNKVSRKKYK